MLHHENRPPLLLLREQHERRADCGDPAASGVVAGGNRVAFYLHRPTRAGRERPRSAEVAATKAVFLSRRARFLGLFKSLVWKDADAQRPSADWP